MDRVEQTVDNPITDIAKLRSQATETYRTLVTHIQSHATLGTAKAYSTILNQVDIFTEQYNEVIENRSNNGTSDNSTTEA